MGQRGILQKQLQGWGGPGHQVGGALQAREGYDKHATSTADTR